MTIRLVVCRDTLQGNKRENLCWWVVDMTRAHEGSAWRGPYFDLSVARSVVRQVRKSGWFVGPDGFAPIRTGTGEGSGQR